MNRIKKRWKTILLALILILFSGSLVCAEVEKLHIRAATSVPPKAMLAVTMDYFLNLVQEASKGKVTYELHAGAVLGGMRETHESMKAGAIHMWSGTFGDLAVFDKLCNINAFPYLYDSIDHGNKVWSKIGPKFYEGISERSGWHVLYTWVRAPRNLTAKKLITKPEDLKGLKIRVPEFPIFVTLWKKYLKATPTVITFGELYTALKTGVVDAQENPVDLTLSAGFFEVLPYYIRTRHTFDIADVHVTENFWKSLSPELKQIFQEAAVKAREWTIQENYKRMYSNYGEAIIKYRTNVIEPDIEAFKNATKGLEDDYPYLKDLVNEIRSIK